MQGRQTRRETDTEDAEFTMNQALAVWTLIITALVLHVLYVADTVVMGMLEVALAAAVALTVRGLLTRTGVWTNGD